ncbi:MAG TPA: homoserine kinase [Thermoanaerobaculia bacterium]|nr:homoserine kinase [Thermoanaerobaculia bacterium]
MKRVRAFAPAGVGNFAAGFDVLGAAVAPEDGSLWGDQVEVREGSATQLVCTGPFADRLPADPAENLVLRTRNLFEEAFGRPLPPLQLTLHKGLPVCSGLGSSAASVAATARALNAWCGDPLSSGDLLEVAGRAEGLASGAVHLDNVAPCLLGGLLLIPPAGPPRTLPFPWNLRVVVASPAFSLATREARRVLPREVPLALAVEHAQNLAAFVHAVHMGDLGLLRATLRDLIAEPWRAGLVPGFRAAQREALAAGALGASLSGAGPAVFAVAEEENAAAVATALAGGFQSEGVESTVRICRIDPRGARIIEREP